MKLDYFPRLGLIACASFFLLQTAFNLVLGCTGRWLVRRARRQPPRWAARQLFLFRILPFALALALTGAYCLPGFLRWEPKVREGAASWFLLAAVAGMLWLVIPFLRAARAQWQTWRLLRLAGREGNPIRVSCESQPLWLLSLRTPLLALAGGWRPRLLISYSVLQALPDEELQAALRHEAAHRRYHDNLKRFCLLLLPPAWPGRRNAQALEQEWARQSEWAADDAACFGEIEFQGKNHQTALALASALVRIAKLQRGSALHGAELPSQLCVSLTGDLNALCERVERLLDDPQIHSQPRHDTMLAAILGAAVMTLISSAFFYLPLLYSLHRALEALVH